MNIKNLQRASEICDDLQKLNEARKLLSEEAASVKVRVESSGGVVVLPSSFRYTILMQLNVEINKLMKEVTEL